MQDHLSQAVEKMRAFYDITPDAPIYQKEFGYYVLDRWIEEGYLRPRSEVADYERYLQETFGYDEPRRWLCWELGGPRVHYTRPLR
ncbi:MAG: hypothetical protein ACLTXL_14080 [Clostridia bacterium]